MQAIDLFSFFRNALHFFTEGLPFRLQAIQLSLEGGDLGVTLVQSLFIELMLCLELVLSNTGFVELGGLSFEVLHRARMRPLPFFNRGFFLVQEVSGRYQFVDPVVAVGKGPFQLLDRAAMGSFPVTQFHFELMHALLDCIQCFQSSPESFPVG